MSLRCIDHIAVYVDTADGDPGLLKGLSKQGAPGPDVQKSLYLDIVEAPLNNDINLQAVRSIR